MSNVIGDKSAPCTNTLATQCVLHKYLQHILQSLQVAQWHLTTLKPQFTTCNPLRQGGSACCWSILDRDRWRHRGGDRGAGSAGGKRHVLTMFITVKYLHCRHKCNFMVCHFQPSCSQRTSASSTCPSCPLTPPLSAPHLNGYLLYYEQNIYELILIFLLLQIQPSTGVAEAAGDGAATWPDDKQVAGTSFGVCHFDFSYFLEQKFIAAFSI